MEPRYDRSGRWIHRCSTRRDVCLSDCRDQLSIGCISRLLPNLASLRTEASAAQARASTERPQSCVSIRRGERGGCRTLRQHCCRALVSSMHVRCVAYALAFDPSHCGPRERRGISRCRIRRRNGGPAMARCRNEQSEASHPYCSRPTAEPTRPFGERTRPWYEMTYADDEIARTIAEMTCTKVQIDLRQRGGVLHQRLADVHQYRDEVHQRRDDLHQRRADLHQRGADLHQRGDEVHQRRDQMHQRRDEVHQRRDEVHQRMS
jgi:hypothetical protein